jgi:copper resistance protein C
MLTLSHGGRSGLLFLLLLIALAMTSSAHAILVDSTPKLNSVVKGPEVAVNLTFNVRVDGKRSRIRLVAADGAVSTLTLDEQSRPDTLQTRAAGLKPGSYTLQWQVLASDGHISQGEIPFAVTRLR